MAMPLAGSRYPTRTDDYANAQMHKVLVVDDEKIVRTTLLGTLRDAGFAADAASSGDEALRKVRRETPDAVLLDLRMPGLSGTDTLRELMKINPDIPVIVVTAYGDIETAVTTIKLGAYDFILKPPDFDILAVTLRRAIEKGELRREVERLGTEVEASLEYLLGEGPAVKKVIGQVKQVAASNFSVVIQGETGTGKSFIANVLHKLSERRDGPFISVDMGAIPESLVESELFGYERGAFTGAEKSKKGFFEMASGGTIVIDELQNMSAFVQGKLLKVAEDRNIFPLGSTRPVRIDVRILGITNVNLKKAVDEKKFREDLFYRLGEAVISIPPLRERKEDISFFTEKFLLETCRELRRKMPEITEAARDLLMEHAWPGNIRELKNVIRRAVLFSGEDSITRDYLECILGNEEKCTEPLPPATADGFPLMALNDAEKYLVRKALECTGGNKTRAAALLRIDYKTLLRKIKLYGI